jgi:hypothetical protein
MGSDTITANTDFAANPHSSLVGIGKPSGLLLEVGVIVNNVIGVGEIATEHVFLSRTGSGQLSMGGWRLEDEDGNVFVFPPLELFEGGAVNVWTTSGAPTVVDLYWGQTNPVWERGGVFDEKDRALPDDNIQPGVGQPGCAGSIC